MKRIVFLVVWLVAGLAHAQQGPAQGSGSAGPGSAQQATTPDVAKQRDWARAMHELKLPKKGCFEATYPTTTWKEVTCKKAPNIPMVPRRGPRPFTIGNTNDVSAQAPTGTISQAVGSFDSVTGVTSVTSPVGGTGAGVANAYTLQLNTNFFTTTMCAGVPSPTCQGWEQFVFYNNGSSGLVFIQYWLIQYNTTCPTGWTQFTFPGETDIYCYRNSSTSTGTPNQTIAGLANMTLSGTLSTTGDSVSFSSGTTIYAATGDNSVGGAGGWRFAEFNIFGAGGGGEATFNAGSSLQPRVRITYGGTAAPLCSAQGFTGETNNLSFGPGAPTVTGTGPALFFIESSAGGAASFCAAAASIGDTHLSTVAGLFYDFQASGDFVLAESDQDFTVQVRQISGAPQWPNASINQGVAARFGKTAVAVCLGSGERGTRVFADGKPLEVGDQPIAITKDVSVGRRGNSYMFATTNGNSMRAEVNATYINVYLGFAGSPANVRGLIANANGDVNKIAARDGTVLTNAFEFDALYHTFGDSWRVTDKDSLLTPCGPGATAGTPSGTFYAKDLDAAVRQKAQAACTAAGVKPGALFDACTLDVAVLGTDTAAAVFATLPPPVAIGEIKGGPGGGPGTGSGSGGPGGGGGGKPRPWWLWLLLGLIVLFVLLWLILRKKTP